MQQLVRRHWAALTGSRGAAPGAKLPWNRVSQYVLQLSLRLSPQRQQELLALACFSAQWVDEAAFARLYDLLLHESDELQAVLPLCPASGRFTRAMFADFFRDKQLDPGFMPFDAWLKAQDVAREEDCTSIVLLRYLHRSRGRAGARALFFAGFLSKLLTKLFLPAIPPRPYPSPSLCSKHNELWDPALLPLHQDMTLPLAHYFIASSHNTCVFCLPLKPRLPGM
jgi:hypothetical protein